MKALSLTGAFFFFLSSLGFAEDADYRIGELSAQGLVTRFNIYPPGDAEPMPVSLNMPGRHNVLNALAHRMRALAINLNGLAFVATLLRPRRLSVSPLSFRIRLGVGSRLRSLPITIL